MRRVLKRFCWSSVTGMIVGIVLFCPVRANAEVLFFDTFEDDPPWDNAPWTFEVAGQGNWGRDLEAGYDPNFQAQAHGRASLWLKDQDNSSYANATCQFPSMGIKPEYMVEFYFWLEHGAAGDVNGLYLYRPTKYDLVTGTKPADITIELQGVSTIEYVSVNGGGHWIGFLVMNIEDSLGEYQIVLDSMKLDSWHRFQVHRTWKFSTLYVDGELIDTYNSRIRSHAPDAFLIGTVDAEDNGEAFWDDFIVTTVPDGEHPRLLFSEAEIPDLQLRTGGGQTPVGISYKQIWDNYLYLAMSSLLVSSDFTISRSGYPEEVLFTYPFHQPEGHSMNWPFWTPAAQRHFPMRLVGMAFAYVITEDTAFINWLKPVLTAMSNWKQWTDPDLFTFPHNPMCLDGAHITMDMATAYDMVFDELNDYEKMSIQNAILSLGVNQEYLPGTPDGPPLEGATTHYAPLGIAALALDLSPGFRQQYVDRAKGGIEWALTNKVKWDPNGGYGCGLLYGPYEMSYIVRFLEALNRAGDQSLFSLDHFENYPSARLHCSLPGALSYPFNVPFCDNGSNAFTGLYYLTKYYQDPYGQRALATGPKEYKGKYFPIGPFLWMESLLLPESPDDLGRCFERMGWTSLRTGWEEDDVVVAFRSGPGGLHEPHRVQHVHLDNNNFVMGTKKGWLVSDGGWGKGATELHNVVLVNGQGQTGADGDFMGCHTSSEYGYFAGDASASYSGLSKWVRKGVLINNSRSLVLWDDISAPTGSPVDLDWLLRAGGTVTFIPPSEVGVKISDDNKLRIKTLLPLNPIITKHSAITGDWHIKVEPPSNIEETQYLTVFYPFEEGQTIPDRSRITTTGDPMEGALVGYDVVLFGESVSNTQYVIPDGYASFNVLVGVLPNREYMVITPYPSGPDWIGSYTIQRVTSGGTGLISFDVDFAPYDREVWVAAADVVDYVTSGGYHGETNWTLTENSEISGLHFAVDTFTVAEGCTVSVPCFDGSDTTGVLLIDAQVVNISGVLTANGAGYASGEGAGTGTQGGFWDGAGGAGFGGRGGSGQKGKAGGTAYSSPDTCRIGSGGGYGGHASAKGGPGGGAIRIKCEGIVTVNGTISSNGEIGNAYFGKAGGGGSGGSVWISGQTLNGSGQVSAQGGPGKTISNTHSGGGAGGRVRIEYTNSNYTGELSVSGGSGPDLATDGQFGTIKVQQADDDASIFISPIHNNTGPHKKEGLITAEFKDTWVRLSANDSILGNVEITAKDSIVVASNGIINGTEKGYGGGSGSGKGEDGDFMKGAGGGAYGGVAGNGHTGKLGGSPYGSHSEPCSLGSGGGDPDPGDYPYNYGGFGGGRVKLDCPDGIVKVNGTVSVNGGTGEIIGNGRAGGGGSGGSIWIVADRLEGAGIVSADGGPGAYSSDDAGGGSGGRIYVSYRDSSFVGRLSVTGGEGHGLATDGQFGTIFIEQINDSVEILVSPVHNNTGPHSKEGFIKSIEFNNEYIRLSANDSILGNVAITASDSIVIASNSVISADCNGYGGGDGTGTGQGGDMLVGGGGAGYGGVGGEGSGVAGNRDGGCTYGEECSPCSLGSGGGDPDPGTYPLYYGGFGGGRIKLKSMGGTIKINGTLSAGGGLGETYGSGCLGGGGSGGSICVTATKIEGTGSIIAKGGDGHTNGTTQSGSGGGGRVCLARNIDNFSGTVSVPGGTAPGDAAGDSGTVCLTTPSGGGCQTGGEIELMPRVFRLFQNHPNPGRGRTTIRYGVPKKANISLRIYDLSGRCVATLVNGERKPGYYSATLDTRKLGTGVYFARFVAAGEYQESKKLVLTR